MNEEINDPFLKVSYERPHEVEISSLYQSPEMNGVLISRGVDGFYSLMEMRRATDKLSHAMLEAVRLFGILITEGLLFYFRRRPLICYCKYHEYPPNPLFGRSEQVVRRFGNH